MRRANLLWASVVSIALALCVAGIALAQDVPGPAVNPGEAVEGVADAIETGQYGILIAWVLMLIVWVLRRIWPSLNTAALPWIAVAIGALGATGAALIADPSQWIQALLAGIGAGLAAAGSWGLFGKKVLPKPKPNPNPEG